MIKVEACDSELNSHASDSSTRNHPESSLFHCGDGRLGVVCQAPSLERESGEWRHNRRRHRRGVCSHSHRKIQRTIDTYISVDFGVHRRRPQVSSPTSPLPLKNSSSKKPWQVRREITVEKSLFKSWKATGEIALSKCDLTVIPVEVWICGPYASVLDLGHNSLKDVPAAICCLCSVQRLLLNANELLDASISWEGLTSLKSITVLSFSQNYLTTLPSALGELTSLRHLHIAKNDLTCLPTEIGRLTRLQVLEANSNRIWTVPSSIGEC
ncbi:LRR repeats and ubiquitin-like domain-containing protein At2g30105 [Actinidia eriantha]|uniref:LRR repeats and ubiquitin-like domain-containing protein At2g30105 n=1 Tax=Actinidia eriantha TaxID=165200 RepID=UPI00258E1E98|nr:LRR repeats and ubiquitin-like domain-containing protein At2g30105 [Actinidia eriantha]